MGGRVPGGRHAIGELVDVPGDHVSRGSPEDVGVVDLAGDQGQRGINALAGHSVAAQELPAVVQQPGVDVEALEARVAARRQFGRHHRGHGDAGHADEDPGAGAGPCLVVADFGARKTGGKKEPAAAESAAKPPRRCWPWSQAPHSGLGG
jgi:hypothetical protein